LRFCKAPSIWLVLQTLQWGPQHGYGIGQAIRANSGESGAAAVDCVRVEAICEQAAREGLSIDQHRKEPVGIRALALGSVAAMTAALNPAKQE
jgi:hypothetical protein